MLLIRHRALGPFLIAVGLFAATVFVYRLRIVYLSNQKFHRLQGYRDYINELSHKMNNLESIANQTSALIRRLENLVRPNHRLSQIRKRS